MLPTMVWLDWIAGCTGCTLGIDSLDATLTFAG